MKSRVVIKNHVRFKGEFKKECVDEFPGRDVAEFIARQLRQRNHVIQSVEVENFWFIIKVIIGSNEYELEVSHSTMREDYWEISCQPAKNSLKKNSEQPDIAEWQRLLDILDEILRSETRIADIKWYQDYDGLLDDYEQRPALQFYNKVYKYLEKAIMPVCGVGLVLIVIGGFGGESKRIFMAIGTILFLFPFVALFFMLAMSLCLIIYFGIKRLLKEPEKR